ncbi:MAG: cytochrome d ubiquinol oxidase subunit II [Mycobacterium sp.]
MSLATALLGLSWLSVTAYALLGGADFGTGFWDLIAGGPQRGRARRALVEHSIGPVWEANHVWLIFVLVVVWTAFPPLFAAVASTLYIPLTLVAIGIIARGSAFAFRKAVTEVWQQRLFGAAFAFSSVITPFFLGTIAGAIASGRVPPGLARGDIITSWANPTSLMCGVLAVGVCAYLSAVYLTADANREAHTKLAEYFRRQGLVSGILVGVLALAAIAVVQSDANQLYHGLTHRGVALVVVSIAMGFLSLLLLARRHYVAVRASAALAVTAVLWGWGIGQYPQLLPGLNLEQAAAAHATLQATAITSAIGLIALVPSLAWLFILFQRGDTADSDNSAQPSPLSHMS